MALWTKYTLMRARTLANLIPASAAQKGLTSSALNRLMPMQQVLIARKCSRDAISGEGRSFAPPSRGDISRVAACRGDMNLFQPGIAWISDAGNSTHAREVAAHLGLVPLDAAQTVMSLWKVGPYIWRDLVMWSTQIAAYVSATSWRL
jgi:hypothetical protein